MGFVVKKYKVKEKNILKLKEYLKKTKDKKDTNGK